MSDTAAFLARRQQLFQQMQNNSVAILFAAPEMIRSRDTYYPYRQDSDFYYLTGFSEPSAVAVFCKMAEGNQFLLFNRPRDTLREQWDGLRAGQEGACRDYGAKAAFPVQELTQHMLEILAEAEVVYYDFGKNIDTDNQVLGWLGTLQKKGSRRQVPPGTFHSLAKIVHEMRLFKEAGEVALMQRAASISAKAHGKAMQQCKSGMWEFELEAVLQYEFLRQGCRAPAYTSIVGGGRNACILHYIQNDALLQEGDLVLIDAGGEYQGYAADITRTFPVNGRFSKPQKILYDIVLAAQEAAIKAVRPGVAWPKIQEIILEILTEGLLMAGILQGKCKDLLQTQAYLPFYMHNSGHWLGLDTHDVGEYQPQGEWRKLAPGMVLTVEPGIYISDLLPNVEKRWQNIGIRIEDDVLVTATGCEILSIDAPKHIDAIEDLMASAHRKAHGH